MNTEEKAVNLVLNILGSGEVETVLNALEITHPNPMSSAEDYIRESKQILLDNNISLKKLFSETIKLLEDSRIEDVLNNFEYNTQELNI